MDKNEFCIRIELKDGAILLGLNKGESTLMNDGIIFQTAKREYNIAKSDIARISETKMIFKSEEFPREKDNRDQGSNRGGY